MPAFHPCPCAMHFRFNTIRVLNTSVCSRATHLCPNTEVSPEEEFDINQDKHKGQFALRKLYHSSDRPLAVLYTAPSCGPCR